MKSPLITTWQWKNIFTPTLRLAYVSRLQPRRIFRVFWQITTTTAINFQKKIKKKMLCNLSELSPKHFNTINVSFKDCIFVFPSFRWKCVIFKSLIDNGQVRLIDSREGWKTVVEYYEENIVESHFFPSATSRESIKSNLNSRKVILN